MKENGLETLQVEENGLDATSLPASSTGGRVEGLTHCWIPLIKEKFVQSNFGTHSPGFLNVYCFIPSKSWSLSYISMPLPEILDAAGRPIIFRSMAIPWIVNSIAGGKGICAGTVSLS